jgi:hypothetical protein
MEFFTKMLEARALTRFAGSKPRDVDLLWFRPAGTGWGTTPDLYASISSIRGALRRTLSRYWRIRSVLVIPQVSRTENNRRFERLFDQACIASAGYLSPAVEVLLLRGIGAMVTVCVRTTETIFVPVGFSIIDPTAVAALEKALRLDTVDEFKSLWRRTIEEDEETEPREATDD